MAKPFTVCALCIISAAVGAGIEPYFEKSIEQGLTELIRGRKLRLLHQQTRMSKCLATELNAMFDTNLKIPPDEYQSFKRKCMGKKYSDND